MVFGRSRELCEIFQIGGPPTLPAGNPVDHFCFCRLRRRRFGSRTVVASATTVAARSAAASSEGGSTVAAANAFLGSLTGGQRSTALYTLDGPVRPTGPIFLRASRNSTEMACASAIWTPLSMVPSLRPCSCFWPQLSAPTATKLPSVLPVRMRSWPKPNRMTGSAITTAGFPSSGSLPTTVLGGGSLEAIIWA